MCSVCTACAQPYWVELVGACTILLNCCILDKVVGGWVGRGGKAREHAGTLIQQALCWESSSLLFMVERMAI